MPVCWGGLRRNALVSGLDSDARVLMVAAPTFDASVGEMLLAASAAAALVVAPPQVYAGEALTALMQRQRVTAAISDPDGAVDRWIAPGWTG